MVDEDDRLVGVLTVDDVVDVIHEEAAEDILRLGGVGDEAISDHRLADRPSRASSGSWSILLRRFLASLVIGLFDATIEQMVALAVLMPIVASMGGNAGTQTMTVTVRALATRDLGPVNAAASIGREALVGLINGLVFALIIGQRRLFLVRKRRARPGDRRGHDHQSAGGGALRNSGPAWRWTRYDVDPAIASGVFVTTVTDVVGFFAFLGLAALWLR